MSPTTWFFIPFPGHGPFSPSFLSRPWTRSFQDKCYIPWGEGPSRLGILDPWCLHVSFRIRLSGSIKATQSKHYSYSCSCLELQALLHLPCRQRRALISFPTQLISCVMASSQTYWTPCPSGSPLYCQHTCWLGACPQSAQIAEEAGFGCSSMVQGFLSTNKLPDLIVSVIKKKKIAGKQRN